MITSSTNYGSSECSPSNVAVTNNITSSVHLYEGSTLELCVRFSSYGTPKFFSFNPKVALSIFTYYNVTGTNATRLIDATSDFVTSAKEASFFGDKVGIVSSNGNYVLFSVSPTSSVKSDLYFLQLQGFSYPAMIQCQDVLELAVGNATAVPASFPCLYVGNTEAVGMLDNQIVWISTNSS